MRRWIPPLALLALAMVALLLWLRSDAQHPPRPHRHAAPTSAIEHGAPATAPAASPTPAGSTRTSAAVVDDEVPASPPCELAGAVVTTEGGLEGATVKVVRLDSGASLGTRSAVTDAAGAFAMAGLPCDRYRATAFAPGYLTATAEVELPASGATILELEPDPGLELLVTDDGDRPLEGVGVRLLARTDGFAGRTTAARTDAAGKVRLEGGPADAAAEVAVEVRPPVGPPQRFTFRVSELRRGRAQARLGAVSELAGRVVDASGAPVAGATVTVLRAGQAAQPGLATTADGRFELHSLAAGMYELVATTPDRGAGRLGDVEVDAAAPRPELEVRLVPGPARLAVRIVDGAGRAVPGCRLRLTPGHEPALRGSAGEDGVFVFAGLPETDAASSWRLEVEKEGYTRAEQRLDVGAGGIEVTIEKTGSVAGTIAAGGELGSYTILAERDGSAATARRYQSSASSRRFQLDDLAPGTYTLSAVAGGTVLARATGVVVRPGEATRAVELQVE